MTPEARMATGPPVALHLIEEFSHRVINEFTEAVLLLSCEARKSANMVARDTLNQAAQRLVAYAAAHRALLPPLSVAPQNLADYIAEICAKLSNAAPSGGKIRIALEAEDVPLAADRCWRIGLILAELVRNAIRHGLRRSEGEVTIRVRNHFDHITCLVGDNGSAVSNPTPGRGQRLIRALAFELGGDVEWQFTPHGSVARLRVPIDVPKATA